MRFFLSRLFVIAALTAALPALLAADFRDGVDAYKRGDWSAAMAAMLPLAEDGDARAQYYLGELHTYGRGVQQNFEEAARWYRAAAEQGDAQAQVQLGAVYDEGRGVDEDDKEAAVWYLAAAQQGIAQAQFVYGRMCSQGRGVTQNDHEAVNWYRAAAGQGSVPAQLLLGFHYGGGIGVAQDVVRAQMWVNIAQTAFASSAAAGVGGDYELTEEQMTQARELARICLDSNYEQCD